MIYSDSAIKPFVSAAALFVEALAPILHEIIQAHDCIRVLLPQTDLARVGPVETDQSEGRPFLTCQTEQIMTECENRGVIVFYNL